MNLRDIVEHLKLCISEKIPVYLSGPPGIGKSDIVRQVCDNLNCKMIDIRLAQLDPTDVRGILIPNMETKKASFLTTDVWPESNQKGLGVNGPGVIFLDEIDKAPISVKNAALELVWDRRIGKYQIPKDWAIVAAGNREEDNCFSVPMGAALGTRFVHFEVEPNLEVWRDWAGKNNISSEIIGYLSFDPSKLYCATQDAPFPTPRSWVTASRLIRGEYTQEKKALIAAAVGQVTAVEFNTWVNIYQHIDSDSILIRGEELKDFSSSKKDFQFATVFAVITRINQSPEIADKYLKNIIKFCKNISREFLAVFVSQMKDEVKPKIFETPDWNEYRKNYLMTR